MGRGNFRSKGAPVVSIGTVCRELYNKCSAVAEMDDRLATIDMGQKLGAALLLGRRSWVPM